MRISDWSSDVCSSDLQLVDAAGAGVYACGRRAPEIELLWRQIGERIEKDIDNAASHVAQRRRAQDRQHQVEAFTGAIGPEGLTEVLPEVGNTGIGGDVEPTAHADGEIDEDAGAADLRPTQVDLEEAVG